MSQTVEIVVRVSDTVSCRVRDGVVSVFLVLLGSCARDLYFHARRGALGS